MITECACPNRATVSHMVTSWMGVDDCGMPRNMSACTDELFRRLGRVAVIGAIIELRLSDIMFQWGRDPHDNGRLVDHLASASIHSARLASRPVSRCLRGSWTLCRRREPLWRSGTQ